jgi:hypothetical protein
MTVYTFALLLFAVSLLSIPGTLTLLKQVRDGKYAQMEAKVRALEIALAEAESGSATVGKQLAALKVRDSIQQSKLDGAIMIAHTLTAQLEGANIQPAQSIEAFLRYNELREEHRATN